MKTASISEARNRLSAYIDLVRRGETVQITDRGNPVARLVPLEAGTKEFDESWLAEMERLGIIRRPRRPPPNRRNRSRTISFSTSGSRSTSARAWRP